MDHSTEFFIGIDVAKTHNAFAIADGERGGEIRYLGEVDASEESRRRLVIARELVGFMWAVAREAQPA